MKTLMVVVAVMVCVWAVTKEELNAIKAKY